MVQTLFMYNISFTFRHIFLQKFLKMLASHIKAFLMNITPFMHSGRIRIPSCLRIPIDKKLDPGPVQISDQGPRSQTNTNHDDRYLSPKNYHMYSGVQEFLPIFIKHFLLLMFYHSVVLWLYFVYIYIYSIYIYI